MKASGLSMAVVLAAAWCAAAGGTSLPQDLTDMVETERAFARTSVERGVPLSFYEFFAEDGISFSPHPGKYRENFRKDPPQPPAQRQFMLNWWPVYGDVAESGELGYNTGPVLFSDLTPQKRPSRHGYFFSVWKKQADGTWRVVVDMGTDVPPVENSAQQLVPYVRAPQHKTGKFTRKEASAARSELLAQEGEFLKAATHHGYGDGYLGYLADYARIHRVGVVPITGKAAAGDYLGKQRVKLTAWEAIDGGVAASGELGYTYGRYELQDNGASPAKVEKGYYTRVWKRDPAGVWKIVADVTS
ncbi:MAG: nuclear transport factor 2 family protein, partial [Acidobacteria bacterium]|nr:nuclear transport factor 2 family protein [Acidobacteriota bacterium]